MENWLSNEDLRVIGGFGIQIPEMYLRYLDTALKGSKLRSDVMICEGTGLYVWRPPAMEHVSSKAAGAPLVDSDRFSAAASDDL